MKKMFLPIAAAMVLSAAGASASSQVQVFIDGELLNTQSAAVIENDTTLIPMRDIFEALGAKIQWIDDEKAVMAYDGTNILKMAIDSNVMILNSQQTELAVPAKLIDEKTYVPLRTVSESLNAEVLWEEETRSVKINTSKNEHNISKNSIEEEISDEEGNVLINAHITYPQLENTDNSEGIAALNAHYENYAKEKITEIKNVYLPIAQQMKQEKEANSEKYIPVLIYFGYDTVYDKFNKLSFVEQMTVGYDGIAEVLFFDSYNYDIEKNEVIELADILNVTQRDFEILSAYSFYLYEDSLICFISTDNMIYYYSYGYEPSLGLTYNDVTKDAFKYNPVTGETQQGAEPMEMFEFSEENVQEETQEEPAQNSVQEFKSVEAMNNVMGFTMVEASSPDRYNSALYEYINGSIGQITYEDINYNKVIFRKAEGDFDVSGKAASQPVSEKVIGNSNVEFYENEEACYACFAIETDGKIYSYSVELESRDMVELEALCKNIIEIESR